VKLSVEKGINLTDSIIYGKYTFLRYTFTLKILDLCSIHMIRGRAKNSILRISKINRKLIQN